jgi:hypothetical protein
MDLAESIPSPTTATVAAAAMQSRQTATAVTATSVSVNVSGSTSHQQANPGADSGNSAGADTMWQAYLQKKKSLTNMLGTPEAQAQPTQPQHNYHSTVNHNVAAGTFTSPAALHPTVYMDDIDYEITPELELEIQIIMSKGFTRTMAIQMQSQRLRAERNAEASIRAFQVTGNH